MSEPAASKSFDFHLPGELIAQDPPLRRGDARLLLVEPGVGVVAEKEFRRLPEILRPGDLLVLNESEVLPARLLTTREDTGGQVEILLIRPSTAPGIWLALARPQKRLRTGTRLVVDPAHESAVLEVIEKRDQGEVLVSAAVDPSVLAKRWGVMPLPPYIRRGPADFLSERGRRDRRRYQTVFARPDDSGAGSVAAPTAGLHFSPAVLAALGDRGVGTAKVSLHVGPGTFREPTAEQVAARRLHREFFHLPREVDDRLAETRRAGGRVIAVGTTSLRVLETVARLQLPHEEKPEDKELLVFGPATSGRTSEFTGEARRQGRYWDVCGETRLFLKPPDRVTAVDGLVTNFHLPDSSLLMLVAALVGQDVWRGVYDHAVQEKFRFYSYGDCMLILPDLRKGN